MLANSPLPFWRGNTLLRAGAQLLVHHSPQYFELRCRLLRDIISEDLMEKVELNEVATLNDEVEWLMNWEVPTNPEYFDTTSARVLDNTLLCGHFRLITTLLTSHRVDKALIGTYVCLFGWLSSSFCCCLVHKMKNRNFLKVRRCTTRACV